jgi:hypothetical protein
MNEALAHIERELGEIRAILTEHIRRTEALEAHVDILRREVSLIAAIRKVISWLGAAIGVAAGLFEIFRAKR